MDFKDLLNMAAANQSQASQQGAVKRYSLEVKPIKKPPKSKVQSAAIKAFLAGKEREKQVKETEERKKKSELLELRSAARHNKRAKAMANRTKDNSLDFTNLPLKLKPSIDSDNNDICEEQMDDELADNNSEENNELAEDSGVENDEPTNNSHRQIDRLSESDSEDNSEDNQPKKNIYESSSQKHSNAKEKYKQHSEKLSYKSGSDHKKLEVCKKEIKLPANKPSSGPIDFNTLLNIAQKKQFEPIVFRKKEKSPDRPLSQQEKEEMMRKNPKYSKYHSEREELFQKNSKYLDRLKDDRPLSQKEKDEMKRRNERFFEEMQQLQIQKGAKKTSRDRTITSQSKTYKETNQQHKINSNSNHKTFKNLSKEKDRIFDNYENENNYKSSSHSLKNSFSKNQSNGYRNDNSINSNHYFSNSLQKTSINDKERNSVDNIKAMRKSLDKEHMNSLQSLQRTEKPQLSKNPQSLKRSDEAGLVKRSDSTLSSKKNDSLQSVKRPSSDISHSSKKFDSDSSQLVKSSNNSHSLKRLDGLQPKNSYSIKKPDEMLSKKKVNTGQSIKPESHHSVKRPDSFPSVKKHDSLKSVERPGSAQALKKSDSAHITRRPESTNLGKRTEVSLPIKKSDLLSNRKPEPLHLQQTKNRELQGKKPFETNSNRDKLVAKRPPDIRQFMRPDGSEILKNINDFRPPPKLPPIGKTMAHRRPVIESDEDSDLDGFVVDEPIEGDDEDYADYSKHIREIFGYDKRRFIGEPDDDCKGMESSFVQQMKEEAQSSRLGRLEDLEDMRQEEEERKRKMKMKAMQAKKMKR